MEYSSVFNQTHVKFIRHELRLAQHNRCYYCQRRLEPGSKRSKLQPTLDHKVPLKRGGEWSIDNLVVACYACNQRKGSMSAQSFQNILSRENDAKVALAASGEPQGAIVNQS